MDISEALAFLSTCRFWSLTPEAMACSWALPSGGPLVRSASQRRHGESLEAMVCRAAAKAAERRASGWKNPVHIGSGTNCAGCGRANRGNAVRLERRLKLPLCPECRRGVGETLLNR
jgi:hypothetical protein